MLDTGSDTAARFLRGSPKPLAKLRLYCFPSAGSGISLLWSWLKDLPAEYELCPIQLPGREDRHREPAFLRLEPLVAAVADALESRLDFPYALFGHSLGALVSFELAREFRRRGLPSPVRLFACSRVAPQLPPRFSRIHRLPDPEFIDQVASRYGPISELVLADPELKSLFFPVLRSDIEVFETYCYRPEAPLSVPISAYGGEDDATVDPPGLHAWAEQTCCEITVRTFPGGHFFPKVARSDFLRAMSGDLAASLRRNAQC